MIQDLYIRDQDGADALEEGFFLLTKHRSGRVSVPVRIWFGPPEDPETRRRWVSGEQRWEYVPIAERRPLDRSPRWQVEINGVLAGDPDEPAMISGRPVDDIGDVWPVCKREPIDRVEYEYRVARADHAEQHDPDDPFGGTGAKIDPMTARLPFA